MIEGNRLAPGTIVHGQYRIVQFLGQGGFGITYAAKELGSGMVLAIKEYFPEDFAVRRSDGFVLPRKGREGEFQKYRRDFGQESLHLSQFDHPNIVCVLARFDSNGTSYFAMEFIQGSRLSDEVAGSGPLEAEAAMLVAENLIEALKTVHDQGMIHRDVKPGNVILGPVITPRHTRLKAARRETMMKFGKPVLLDFGSARVVDESGAPLTCLVSLGFSAPEQWDKHALQTPQIDLYGLAATLYFCLGGGELASAPARRDGLEIEPAASRFSGAAPARLLRAIDRAIELEPSRRQRSIREFREEVFA